MGSSESTLSSFSSSTPTRTPTKAASLPIHNDDDEITTVSERTEGVDPLVERFKSLKIGTPILTCSSPSFSSSSNPSEASLTDILIKKRPTAASSSSSLPATLDPKVLLELFSMYRDWQEEQAKRISQRQEEIENKIEVADALAVKLFQRFNFSVSAMRTTAHHLSEVQPLQVEVGELKGRLTEVISNCDALCKRIAAEGPQQLRSSVKPFSAVSIIADLEPQQSLPSSSSSSPTLLVLNTPTTTTTAT